MKIVYNKYIPFTNHSAINICGVVFAKSIYKPLSAENIRHEAIHTQQMRELLYIPFYLWYVIEWLVRLFQYKSKMEAYYNISFEREAYANHGNTEYLKNRKLFSFLKYI
ncbi:hypothetical protein JGH11_16050 [Dysgonomonas sp. Marseille-P4677]|uniref:hypothetical protein n=1 Tax=Dysgonomonas sp. Marseille-P4677 TaxID=2364790 RepID=UPI0019149190|nr:hypothetical protein [Dysgonomonas sp. Marseille-P4677]MBK5722389.1 hypothetical protein [Dysgonomonas sp. Marseille-P4677]